MLLQKDERTLKASTAGVSRENLYGEDLTIWLATQGLPKREVHRLASAGVKGT
jgi:hypothetical protein